LRTSSEASRRGWRAAGCYSEWLDMALNSKDVVRARLIEVIGSFATGLLFCGFEEEKPGEEENDDTGNPSNNTADNSTDRSRRA